jgi:hypothetical protein
LAAAPVPAVFAECPKEPLLITGGAGYIGSHTVRHLLEQHEKIVVLDNLVFGHREALPLDRVTFVEGDMSRRGADGTRFSPSTSLRPCCTSPLSRMSASRSPIRSNTTATTSPRR